MFKHVHIVTLGGFKPNTWWMKPKELIWKQLNWMTNQWVTMETNENSGRANQTKLTYYCGPVCAEYSVIRINVIDAQKMMHSLFWCTAGDSSNCEWAITYDRDSFIHTVNYKIWACLWIGKVCFVWELMEDSWLRPTLCLFICFRYLFSNIFSSFYYLVELKCLKWNEVEVGGESMAWGLHWCPAFLW